MCIFIVVCVLCRGQISRDYEQEFSSVKVGPRRVRQHSEGSQTTLLSVVKGRFPFRKKCQNISSPSFADLS